MDFAIQIGTVFAFFAALAIAPSAAAAQSGFDFPHSTDFLTAGCFTHVFPGLDATQRKNCIDQIKSRNYTHFYIYAYNETDYGGPSFDFYTDPVVYKTILQEITDVGLKAVVWLHPDDALLNRNRTITELKARMSDLVPVIDPLVSSYVLGLELDEYWGESRVDALGKHLDTLTDKKIAVHQLKGRWNFCRLAWCDYMMLQYGFGKTEVQIQTMTKDAMNDLGKPVVAGEYSVSDESVSVKLGKAAVSVGADGFGNGGTPAEGANLPLERLNLPPGFGIEVLAEVPGARSLAVSADGRTVYVGTRGTKVFAVTDPGGGSWAVSEVLRDLKVPNGLALRDDSLFVVEQHRIIRLDPDGGVTVILPPGVLPDENEHGWRYAAFGPDDKLYVAVGAPCNICKVTGYQGTIVRMNPDGSGLGVFAKGVRNSVGFDWRPGSRVMFFTDNGGDRLGDLIPPDELNRAWRSGFHFGFPYVYGDNVPYPQFADEQPPRYALAPELEFDAHVAALGIRFYRGSMFPKEYRNDALVAQHGSWNRTDPIGYRVMRVHFNWQGRATGKEVFIDGWLGSDGEAWGRVADLAELPDGSLLISDDFAGVIYRVSYIGN
jgi:glucose/arabinose dehydrogenase